jgi:hypothetical protein
MFDDDAGTDQRGKKKGTKYVEFFGLSLSRPFASFPAARTDMMTDNQHAGRSQRSEPNCPAGVQTEKTTTGEFLAYLPFGGIGN